METSDNKSAASQQANSLSGISREKHWEESTDAEKIERLRHELVQAWRMIQRLMDASHSMAQHQHGVDGKILVPLERNGRDAPDGYTRRPWGLLTERERK